MKEGRRPPPLHLTLSAMAQVVIGGVFGAAARGAVDQALPHGAAAFPTATLTVNLTGAFVLGVVLEALVRAGDDSGGRRHVRLVLGTGFLGAFTTYSTFAVDADLLVRADRPLTAVLYVVLTLVGGLVATTAGIAAGALRNRRQTGDLPVDPDIEGEPGVP